MNFNLLLPPKTIFGWGRLIEAGSIASELGDCAYVVGGSRRLVELGLLSKLEDALYRSGVKTSFLGTIANEPTVRDVNNYARLIRQEISSGDYKKPFLVALGGGAAIDLAKAVAAVTANPHIENVRDALEGVGKGLTISFDSLPVFAIPTTAGTGAECTKNAVISSDDEETVPFKKSLRSDKMIPSAVLIDPELTVSLPPSVTATSGLDAITQLIESYLTKRASRVTNALALEGLQAACPAIKKAIKEPDNKEARTNMSCAAYLSGITLANAGLGFAHGVASALGITAKVAHGLACAVMLPHALKVNSAVRKAEIAKVVELVRPGQFKTVDSAVDAAPTVVLELLSELGLPTRLRDIGVTKEQLPALVKGCRGNSMNGNPRDLADEEIFKVLEEAL